MALQPFYAPPGTSPWEINPNGYSMGPGPRTGGAPQFSGGGGARGGFVMPQNMLGPAVAPHLGFGPNGLYGPQPGSGDYAGSLTDQFRQESFDRADFGRAAGAAGRDALSGVLSGGAGGGGGFSFGGGPGGAPGGAPGPGLPARVNLAALERLVSGGRPPPPAPWRPVGRGAELRPARQFGSSRSLPAAQDNFRRREAPALRDLEAAPGRISTGGGPGGYRELEGLPERVSARGGPPAMPSFGSGGAGRGAGGGRSGRGRGPARSALMSRERNEPAPDPLLDSLLRRMR